MSDTMRCNSCCKWRWSGKSHSHGRQAGHSDTTGSCTGVSKLLADPCTLDVVAPLPSVRGLLHGSKPNTRAIGKSLICLGHSHAHVGYPVVAFHAWSGIVRDLSLRWLRSGPPRVGHAGWEGPAL